MKFRKWLTKCLAVLLALILMWDGAGMQALAANYDFKTISDYDDAHIGGLQWYHSVLETPRIWHSKSTGQGVRVAVISTGYTPHDDMQVNQRSDLTGTGMDDLDGQGTAMCGIIGAKANGKFGCGIAPDAYVISIKASPHADDSNAFILSGAIQEAINSNADIICIGNMRYEDNEQVEQAILKAYRLGIPVFVAIGDDSSNAITYPSAYKGAIPVAAVNGTLTKTSTSNYGSKVRYCAPGTDFVVLSSTESDIAVGTTDSSRNSSAYAAAIVAGQAALLWKQADGEGQKKVDNLLKLMDRSCVRVKGSGMGKGMVSLTKAYKMPAVTAAPAKPVFVTKPGKVEGYNVAIEFETPDLGTKIYYSLDGKPIKVNNGVLSDNAREYTYKFSATLGYDSATRNNIITVHALAYNANTGMASSNAKAVYRLEPKPQPINDLLIDLKNWKEDLKVLPGEKLALEAIPSPNYPIKEKLTWKLIPLSNVDQPDKVKISNTGVITVSKDAKPCSYAVMVETESGIKNSKGFTFSVIHLDNPVKTITMKKTSYTMVEGDRIPLEGTLTYQDGTKEAFDMENMEWSSDNSNAVIVDEKEGQYVLQTGYFPGKAQVTGYTTDGSGKRITLNVTVKPLADDIEIIMPQEKIAQGNSATFKAIVTPKDAVNKKVTWSVSPEGQGVTVSPTTGKVTVSKDAVISRYDLVATVSYDGRGYQEATQFYVIPAEDKAKKIAFAQKSVDLFRNQTSYEYVTVECDSDNWEVVTDNLVGINAYKADTDKVGIYMKGGFAGTTVLTVRTTDGSNKKATLRINVKNRVSGLMIAPAEGRSDYIAEGSSLQMNAYYVTETGKVEAKGKKINWSSSGRGVTISPNGKVTSNSANSGMASTITAELADGSGISASYTLIPSSKVKELVLADKNSREKLNSKITLSAGSHQDYLLLEDGKPFFGMERIADFKVSREGLRVYVDNSGTYVHVFAEKPGTYTVTCSLKDGNKTKKNYTFVVK